MNAMFLLVASAWLAGADPVMMSTPVQAGPSCGCGGAQVYQGETMGQWRTYEGRTTRSQRSQAEVSYNDDSPRPTFMARLKGVFGGGSSSSIASRSSRSSRPSLSYSTEEPTFVESAPMTGSYQTGTTWNDRITPVPATTVSTPVPSSFGNPMPVGEPPVTITVPEVAQ